MQQTIQNDSIVIMVEKISNVHPNQSKKMVATITKRYENMTLSERSIVYGKFGAANNYKGGIGFNGCQYCPKCNIAVIADSAKCCDNCRDRTGVNNPFYGRNHSIETLERIKLQTQVDLKLIEK